VGQSVGEAVLKEARALFLKRELDRAGGTFTPAMVTQLCDCLLDIKRKVHRSTDETVEFVALGTAALREAANAADVEKEVLARTGVPLRVISQVIQWL
jgi:exopolyphosphatase/pppGpp-phosphohydrolase